MQIQKAIFIIRTRHSIDVGSSLSNKVGNLALETPNNNCNDIVDFGLYKVRGDTANAYTSVAGNLVLNAPWDTNTIFQLFCDWGNLEIAYRTKTYGIENPWCDWVKIATATPPQEYDLPLADGITALQPCTYYKNQFSEVTLGGCTSGLVSDGVTIATLPEGFRPDHPIERPATFTSNGNRYAGSVFIAANGIVSIHTPATATNVIFAASFLAKN